MKKYLIQKDNDSIETQLVLEQLTENYELVLGKDIAPVEFGTVPIGDIDFVAKALELKQVPIEVPTYLQTYEFLKRTYKIGNWEEIPQTGKWFIKDASNLKNFSICTTMDFWYNPLYFDYQPKTDLDTTPCLPKDSDYVISSPLHIQSEYRVYVIDGTIMNISYYKGNPTILPNVDLIKKAVCMINENEKYLKSYALDVAVCNYGTAVLELHNFSSIGLYSAMWEKNLLTAYEQGIEYLLYDNSIKYK